jgi:hypothetical protein
MISDPAALQYIFVKSGYRFHKQENRTVLIKILNGRGLLSAEGRFWPRNADMRWSVIYFLKVMITDDSEE